MAIRLKRCEAKSTRAGVLLSLNGRRPVLLDPSMAVKLSQALISGAADVVRGRVKKKTPSVPHVAAFWGALDLLAASMAYVVKQLGVLPVEVTPAPKSPRSGGKSPAAPGDLPN